MTIEKQLGRKRTKKHILKNIDLDLAPFFKKSREEHKNCCAKCRAQVEFVLELAKRVRTKNEMYLLYLDNKIHKQYRKKNCEKCNIDINLQVHHIDLNFQNNAPDNLMTLCGNCHTLIHYKVRN